MIDTFMGIAKNAAKNASHDNTYIDNDGFECCKICGGRKQVDTTIGEKTIRVYCMCKCESEAYERGRAEFVRETKLGEIASIKRNGFSNSSFEQYTFNNDKNPDSYESCVAKRYAENFEDAYDANEGLMFVGNTGNGKTYYSACIANAIAENGITFLMSSATELERRMSANYGADRANIIDQIARVNLLILDDLGAERDTPTAMEALYAIVNARYNAHKPIIVSTNLSAQELVTSTDMAHKRIYERIVEHTIPVVMTNPNQRKTLNPKKQRIKNILGVG